MDSREGFPAPLERALRLNEIVPHFHGSLLRIIPVRPRLDDAKTRLEFASNFKGMILGGLHFNEVLSPPGIGPGFHSRSPDILGPFLLHRSFFHRLLSLKPEALECVLVGLLGRRRRVVEAFRHVSIVDHELHGLAYWSILH